MYPKNTKDTWKVHCHSSNFSPNGEKTPLSFQTTATNKSVTSAHDSRYRRPCLEKNKCLSSLCNSHARLWDGGYFFFPNCKQHRELQRQQGQKILGWNYRSGNKHKRMSRDFQHVVCRLQGQWRTTMESKLYIWHLQRRPNPWKRKLRPHDPRKGLKPSSSSSRTWMRLFHEVHSTPGFKGTSFNTTDTFTYDSAMGRQYLVHLKKEQAPH